MTARLALSLALAAALAAVPVLAQRAPTGAAALYHDAAAQYVAGELAPAEAAARQGLRLAPDNAKLQALLDLILQDQENQDGDQNQDPRGDSGDDGQQGEDSGQDGQPGEQGDSGLEPGDDGQNEEDPAGGNPDEPDETERDGTDQGAGQDGQNDDADGQGARPGEGGETPQGEAAAAGQMSRAQAERLLDAVGGDEQLLLRELTRGQSRIRRGDKDW